MSTGPSDEALMRGYRDGDAEALRSLFVRHARKLQTFFFCLLGSLEQTEELSQKTWLRLHRIRKSYSNDQPFVPWLYTLAVQLRRDSVRDAAVQASPPAAACVVNDAPSLVRALLGLPDSYREVVVLHRLIELPFPTIAHVLKATESAVEQRAQQGYEQLATLTGSSQATDRVRAGQAVFDPAFFQTEADPVLLERSARALLPVVARDLQPVHAPAVWLAVGFVVLLLVAVIVWLPLFR